MAGQLTLAELRLEAEALEGDDVVSFIYKQQELYRNERAEEHAARAAAAEAERVERPAGAERAERAAEAEREIEH